MDYCQAKYKRLTPAQQDRLKREWGVAADPAATQWGAIGWGADACVWPTPDGKHVVKITSSVEDARVAELVRRAKTRYQDVLARVAWVGDAGVVRLANGRPGGIPTSTYVIVTERLFREPTPSFHNEAYAKERRFLDAVNALQEAESDGTGWRSRSVADYGTAGVLATKKFARLEAVGRELGADLCGDAHAGNWGFRVPGDLTSAVLLDFGYSAPEKSPRLPKLNPLDEERRRLERAAAEGDERAKAELDRLLLRSGLREERRAWIVDLLNMNCGCGHDLQAHVTADGSIGSCMVSPHRRRRNDCFHYQPRGNKAVAAGVEAVLRAAELQTLGAFVVRPGLQSRMRAFYGPFVEIAGIQTNYQKFNGIRATLAFKLAQAIDQLLFDVPDSVSPSDVPRRFVVPWSHKGRGGFMTGPSLPERYWGVFLEAVRKAGGKVGPPIQDMEQLNPTAPQGPTREPTAPITTYCAWCGKHLRGPATPAPGTRISHGICPGCMARELASGR